jgi:flagellar basal body-associated protein FliL
MTKLIYWLLGVLVLIAVAVAAVVYFSVNSEKDEANRRRTEAARAQRIANLKNEQANETETAIN